MKKYSKGETLKTSLAQQFKGCVKDYNIVFKDNDNNLNIIPNYFTDVEVIDFDCIEEKLSSLQHRKKVKSVDSIFVISDNSLNREIVLVELRLNYTNMANLVRKELEEKVKETIKTLKSFENINIHSEYFFVFQPNRTQQARNRLNRMNPKIPTTYISIDINSLKQRFFD
jgi:hypothetical protein